MKNEILPIFLFLCTLCPLSTFAETNSIESEIELEMFFAPQRVSSLKKEFHEIRLLALKHNIIESKDTIDVVPRLPEMIEWVTYEVQVDEDWVDF